MATLIPEPKSQLVSHPLILHDRPPQVCMSCYRGTHQIQFSKREEHYLCPILISQASMFAFHHLYNTQLYVTWKKSCFKKVIMRGWFSWRILWKTGLFNLITCLLGSLWSMKILFGVPLESIIYISANFTTEMQSQNAKSSHRPAFRPNPCTIIAWTF